MTRKKFKLEDQQQYEGFEKLQEAAVQLTEVLNNAGVSDLEIHRMYDTIHFMCFDPEGTMDLHFILFKTGRVCRIWSELMHPLQSDQTIDKGTKVLLPQTRHHKSVEHLRDSILTYGL